MDLNPKTETLVLNHVMMLFPLTQKKIRVAGAADFSFAIVSQDDLDNDRIPFSQSVGGVAEAIGDQRPDLYLALKADRDIEVIVQTLDNPGLPPQIASYQTTQAVGTPIEGSNKWIWVVIVGVLLFFLLKRK